MIKDYYAKGQWVAMKKGSMVYFLVSDHLGSTAITANSTTGALIGELRYKAWGEQRFSSGTMNTNRRYTGQLRENALGGTEGLYFFNARWVDVYLNDALFMTGRFASWLNEAFDARGVVLWKNVVYLPAQFNAQTVVHELAHVFDNNLAGGGLPATYVGGGPADAMVQFLGGHPDNCIPRFRCENPIYYSTYIAGESAWPKENTIANNGVADDFAETFSYAIYDPSRVPSERLMWMNIFISVSATILP